MKRTYSTTWGAQLVDGGVRFRLWAPHARSVSVVLIDAGERLTHLTKTPDGWFEGVVAGAAAGSRYLYEIDDALRVADPASRFQPQGVERPSEVIDPSAFDWPDTQFAAPPYHELNVYELHVGTFTEQGTYEAAQQHLAHLVQTGVRAVELMPLSQAAGTRNWGYDGVHHYAPAFQYGRPDDLKRFIVAAHEHGLAVLLDVVYNHFGPQGNYLPQYAPQFFSAKLATPWGAGIDYCSAANDAVRRYAIENACYWLVEYGFDGLRLDAAPMIFDTRPKHVLHELVEECKSAAKRTVYLIAEDVKNEVTDLVAPFDGRWSDDAHHALHVAITGERGEYFKAFADAPIERLGTALTTEAVHRLNYLQNHDQIGNRPLGERLGALTSADAVRAAAAALLLAPGVPLIFMGEEWGARTPFLFFCDFEPNLAKRVRDGRRVEFAGLAGFDDPHTLAAIVDPASVQAMTDSRLRWSEIERAEHRAMLEWYRTLFRVRAERIVPLISKGAPASSTYRAIGERGLTVRWQFKDGPALVLDANFGEAKQAGFDEDARGCLVFSTHGARYAQGAAPSWSVRWSTGE